MLAGSCLVFGQGQRHQTTEPIDFNRDIRPILSDTCFTCHGPDPAQRMAGLRFDNKEGAFGKAGVIVPGDSLASRLIKRITATEPEMRMPPAASGRTLSARQVELLRRWIDEGAKWDTHWAYLPANRQEPPKVFNPAWPSNAIDNFILVRLEREGLKPSPPADKVTLLRRATLDLTGLPPTPAEIDSFLKDASPDAYEKRVDQLLSSPHYGEAMAMRWLDLARYADTHGYHIDSHRDMWRWRDWVINAFNRKLTTFDAPDREKCTARRALTNTPLQALVLMNDPTYIEAARWLAQRAMTEGGRDAGSRISFIFRRATARLPSLKEARVLRNLFEQQLARYHGDKKAAIDLLRVGESQWDAKLDASELAAWTIVASAILNLDETITRE